jgi:lysozyme
VHLTQTRKLAARSERDFQTKIFLWNSAVQFRRFASLQLRLEFNHPSPWDGSAQAFSISHANRKATMEISQQGLDLMKRSEGFRSHQYLDLAGLATIGFGHRVIPPESFPKGITEQQGTAILMDDVKLAEQAVTKMVHVPLTQGQFDALVDFCFNVGPVRLAASTLLKELNDGQYAHAGLQLLRWDYAAGTPNTALQARRVAELQLWTGCSPSRDGKLGEASSANPCFHPGANNDFAVPEARTPVPQKQGCETVNL